ncbi:MAG: hypothetical protein AB7O21_03630 [Gammaproteobacteria bacterium]
MSVPSRALAVPFLVTCLLTAPAVQALSVNTKVVGTLLGDSNFGDGARSTSEFHFDRETSVPGSLPPLFGKETGFASVDGATGTLKASAVLSSPGGVLAGASLEMQASMEETFEISVTSGGGLRRPGVVGVGDPGDDFITIRARGVLTGGGSVGSGTGVPPGTPPSSAGSTRAVMSFGLSIGGSFLRGTQTITELTTLTFVDEDVLNVEGSSILGFVEIEGNTLTMNVDRTRYFALSDRRILFTASLLASARVGTFDGAQAFANYGNSSYFNVEIEDGFFWLPGNAGNRNFLIDPAFPGPNPVPLPPALPLFGAALGALAGRRRLTRRR